jgi:glycosyltransferase involved in cell wall biosynthesis
MRLSILLRTRNAQGELEKFRECGRAGDEMVVVDHASRDRTCEIARSMGARVIPYTASIYSYGAALNQGLAVCTGDWVLVVSQHVEPIGEDFWERLRRDLAALPSDIVACQAPVFLTSRAVRGEGITVIGPEDLDLAPWNLFGNTCCAYRRDWLLRQPFDESLPTAEDVEWCLRIVREGARICIDHRLPVLYRNRAPLVRYWRRGRADLRAVGRIYGISVRPSIFSGLAFIIKDTAHLLRGRLPAWLWIRLMVKRLAEMSLRLAP